MDQIIDRDFKERVARFSFEDYQQSLRMHSDNGWLVRFRVIDNQVARWVKGRLLSYARISMRKLWIA